jgi:hypothetical protein
MSDSKYQTLLATAQDERDPYQLLLDIDSAIVTHLDLTRLLHPTSNSIRKVHCARRGCDSKSPN